METFPKKLFFVFLAGAFWLCACGGGNANQNTNGANRSSANSNSNVTKDDAEEFGKIVNLPVTPEEIAWRESESNNTKKLTAVLKVSSADAQTLVTQAEKHRPAAPSELDAEGWFPPELIAKSQESGDDILRGNSYAANDFFIEPYKNGKLTRINDSNYFVLELSSAQ